MPGHRDARLFDDGAGGLLFCIDETWSRYLIEHGNLAGLILRMLAFGGARTAFDDAAPGRIGKRRTMSFHLPGQSVE
ncbi:MAG TPA: hypothetical protein VGC36_07525, partial [Rhizomicrobium sp.]